MKNNIYELLNHVEMDLTEYCEIPLSAKETIALKSRVERAIKKMKRNTRQKKMRIAAASIVCVLAAGAIGGGIGYAQVGSGPVTFIRELVSNKENMTENIKENVFEDSNEHIRIEVEELLSDGMHMMATVRYEALDDIGEAWLSKLDSNQISGYHVDEFTTFLATNYQGNTTIYPVSSGFGNKELNELRTDTSKVFVITNEANFPVDTVTTNCVLTYWLPYQKHTANLDTSANIPVYEYHLEAVDDAKYSDYYEPVDIRFSEMSFIIYGHYKGTENDIMAAIEDTVEEVCLLNADGSAVPIGTNSACWGPIGDTAENVMTISDEDDYIVLTSGVNPLIDGTFCIPDEWDTDDDPPVEINPEDAVGVRLVHPDGNAVDYRFRKARM